MSVNFKLLGKRIKEVRMGKGIAQAELAAMCKTSAQYLSQIENGRKQASLQILVAIGQALEVSLDELLAGNQMGSMAVYNEEIEQIFMDCSQYEKRVLFEALSSIKNIIRDNKELLLEEIEKY